MTSKEFIKKLCDVADNQKTLYVMGCFGAPLNEENAKRYKNAQSYNRTNGRDKKIDNAVNTDPPTFGFDCVCLIKGILWGFCADKNAVYGGASYKSNGVDDIGEETMINLCPNVSTDFSDIVPGEAVWMKGHIGVYIGDGKVVECTPIWKDGVQYSNLGNLGYKTGNYRIWEKHGKLPYIEYEKTARDYIKLIAEKAKFSSPEPAIEALMKVQYKYADDMFRKNFEAMK